MGMYRMLGSDTMLSHPFSYKTPEQIQINILLCFVKEKVLSEGIHVRNLSSNTFV